MKLMNWLMALSAGGLLWVTGCVSTVDGRKTAGVPFLSDSVQTQYDWPIASVWKAVKATLSSAGTLTVENVAGNTLEAKVDKTTVWVAVDALSPKSTQTIIQVRTKMGGTDKPLAHNIDKEIAVRLATTNFNVTPAAKPPPSPPAGASGK